tara:strand:- start:71 stop:223 length:153 start_codon:yes stop_codon:yes gene_type:complete
MPGKKYGMGDKKYGTSGVKTKKETKAQRMKRLKNAKTRGRGKPIRTGGAR